MTTENQLLRDAEKLANWHNSHAKTAKDCAMFASRKDLQEIAQGHDSAESTIRGLMAALSRPTAASGEQVLTVASALDLVPLDEDPCERKMFDDTAQEHGSIAAAISWQLRIMARSHPQGSFAQQLAVMANEVAKMPYDAGSTSTPQAAQGVGEVVRLAQVAIDEAGDSPKPCDWMDAALKVCRHVVAHPAPSPAVAVPDASVSVPKQLTAEFVSRVCNNGIWTEQEVRNLHADLVAAALATQQGGEGK